MFLNRFRVVKDKDRQVLQVVIDRRVIDEQSRGAVSKVQIPAICLVRGEDGQLVNEKTVLVSDREFITEFTNHLTNEAMGQLAPLLTGGEDPTASSIPI